MGCHGIHPALFSWLLLFSSLIVFQLSPISLRLTTIILSNEVNTFLLHWQWSPQLFISNVIKNWTPDIRFPAFSLARRTQVISSYTCTTKYGQWKHQERKLDKKIASKLAAIENRLAAELTSINSGTGPKYKWNSLLHCSECFRMTKTSAIIVIKKFFF